MITTCAIASQKGGVGKTTLTINLSYSLAKRGWRVLVVDTDPQGGIGCSLSPKVSKCPGFYDILAGLTTAPATILATRLAELSILPSGSLEAYFRVADSPVPLKSVNTLLDSVSDEFDLIMIDTPAGLGGITRDLLKTTQWVLLPTLAEPLAARSLPHALESLVRLRREGHPIQLAGVVLTMTQNDHAESSGVTRDLREMLPGNVLIPHSVPRSPHFLTATEKGVPLSLLRKNPPPEALAVDIIAAELEQRLGLTRKVKPHESTQLLD